MFCIIMITRKENLLIRPWQQRKFEHHRKKVASALPAIDTSPPPYRGHVAIKQKKQQKENERCEKIEKDNYLLLQKINYLMRISRVDNTWRKPRPNFLNKVGIYNTVVPRIEDLIEFDIEESKDQTPKSRKLKCYACTEQNREDKTARTTVDTFRNIPEERISWETEKKLVSKIRSKSVPVKKSEPIIPLPIIKEQSSAPSTKPSSSKIARRGKTYIRKQDEMLIIEKSLSDKEPQSIVLTRGCLKLSVNFPSDTLVKFHEGNVEKFLMRGYCHCKNSPTTEVF